MSESFTVRAGDAALAAERWPGGQPTVVLLHEGVSDRRGWAEVARRLAPAVTVVAYDRRGFGETAISAGPFSHVEDLLAVLAEVAPRGTWRRRTGWRRGCGWTALPSRKAGSAAPPGRWPWT